MEQIPLGRVDTSENYADIFMNDLTSTQLQRLLSPRCTLGVNRNNHSQAVPNAECHRHSETCEGCNLVGTDDFLCVVCTHRMTIAYPCAPYVSSRDLLNLVYAATRALPALRRHARSGAHCELAVLVTSLCHSISRCVGSFIRATCV